MTVKDAIAGLGGAGAVGARLGERAKTVGMWGARDSVPAAQLLPFWRLCLAAGLPWEPPGAAEIRAQLGAAAPAQVPPQEAA